MLRLKFNGVYNEKIAEHLNAYGIRQFSFDLRPKSFNFTSLKIIETIVNPLYLPQYKISLLFQQEKSSVIEGLLQQIEKFKSSEEIQALTFEFLGDEDLEFFRELTRPFTFHFQNHPWSQVEEILKLPQCRGLIVGEGLFPEGQLQRWPETIYRLLQIKKNNQELELSLDAMSPKWGSLDFFAAFNTISFSMNGQLESSYRQVNWSHLDYTLGKCLRLIEKFKEISPESGQ